MWPLLLLGLAGLALSASGKSAPSSSPKLRGVWFPPAPSPTPEDSTESDFMTDEEFYAELDSRFGRGRDAIVMAHDDGVKGTSGRARARLMSYMLGLRVPDAIGGVNHGDIKGNGEHPAEKAFRSGAPIWEAYAGVASSQVTPEVLNNWWRFAQTGVASMVGQPPGEPEWTVLLAGLGMGTRPRIARWLLGESDQRANEL